MDETGFGADGPLYIERMGLLKSWRMIHDKKDVPGALCLHGTRQDRKSPVSASWVKSDWAQIQDGAVQ